MHLIISYLRLYNIKILSVMCFTLPYSYIIIELHQSYCSFIKIDPDPIQNAVLKKLLVKSLTCNLDFKIRTLEFIFNTLPNTRNDDDKIFLLELAVGRPEALILVQTRAVFVS